MKKTALCAGICIITAGLTVLLTCFLPTVVLVCVEAVLLMLAGVFCIKA